MKGQEHPTETPKTTAVTTQYTAKRQKGLSSGVKHKSILSIHKSRIRTLDEPYINLYQTTKPFLPKGFKYDLIRLDMLEKTVSFIKIKNFDTDPDPVFEKSYVARINGAVREYCPNHRHVYHHKWVYVTDRYTGFNVAESKRWSETWMNAPELNEYREKLGKQFEKRCEEYYYWVGKILKLISPHMSGYASPINKYSRPTNRVRA